MKKSRAVTVVYENEAKRAEATRFCKQLVERFWKGAELDLSWWSVRQLRELGAGGKAMEKAGETDVVVLALHAQGEIPLEVDAWMENWLSRRGDREGILVGLLGTNESGEVAEKHQRLRKSARRGGLDYLTDLPEFAAQHISDSLESYYERAHRMTSVMDEILRHAPIPHLLT